MSGELFCGFLVWTLKGGLKTFKKSKSLAVHVVNVTKLGLEGDQLLMILYLNMKGVESLDWGLDTTNSHVVGGALGMDFTPPSTLQGVTTLPFPKSVVFYNGKVGNLFFQANLIIINHPHWTQFSQEWVMSVQKGGRKIFNKSKSSTPISQQSVCRKVVVKHNMAIKTSKIWQGLYKWNSCVETRLKLHVYSKHLKRAFGRNNMDMDHPDLDKVLVCGNIPRIYSELEMILIKNLS